MRVREVTLCNVMTHALSKVVLPSKGVVLVTGKNGAGKSSLIEAVSVGAWEEPLRRKPVWSDDKASITLLAEVGSETLLIQRTRTKAKSGLSFSTTMGRAVTYETKTKAQTALDRLIGSHMLWRRTCVFSSHDADHFTLATDGERKKLLEDILGLERFDAAHAAVLRDRREGERALQEARSKLALADERRASAKARLGDALERLRALPSSYPINESDLADLDAKIADLEEDMSIEQSELDKAKARFNKLNAEVEAAEKKLSRMGALTTCTLCEQAISHDHLETQRGALDALVEKHAATMASLENTIDVGRVAVKTAERSIGELRDQRGQIRNALRAKKEADEQRATLEDGVRRLRLVAEEAADVVDECREIVKAAELSSSSLSAVEKVLSLTGVRSYLLSQALSGVEEVANTWLARMAGNGLALRLQPYAEKATGGVKDAISLEVDGAGGGHGYRAASGGERRRIDIALMLALAEIAEAAVGVPGGTLFFDEVFDALDGDGVDAACAVLDELSADRCVVVISHNKDLAAKLKVTRHLTVDGGKIA